ncbi:hypothetical protein BS47DRAFT_1369052 [Hydnum rufescens UP504]|uniref:Uncharacterized protein n=1 Tax=Hydnum rufescens UP504 TaxID=1448309 RepID=A0A9P6ADU5_9AGAM|nr:hypothetical protein BS47DRAFT_1369052 [Hydnum rufescens UP504]
MDPLPLLPLHELVTVIPQTPLPEPSSACTLVSPRAPIPNPHTLGKQIKKFNIAVNFQKSFQYENRLTLQVKETVQKLKASIETRPPDDADPHRSKKPQGYSQTSYKAYLNCKRAKQLEEIHTKYYEKCGKAIKKINAHNEESIRLYGNHFLSPLKCQPYTIEKYTHMIQEIQTKLHDKEWALLKLDPHPFELMDIPVRKPILPPISPMQEEDEEEMIEVEDEVEEW